MNIRTWLRAAAAAGLMAAIQGCGASAAAPAPASLKESVVAVESIYPRNGQSGVNQNSAISVTFNEDMVSSTVNERTFTLRENGTTLVPGNILPAGKSATFAPVEPLKPFTLYVATVTTGMVCADESTSLQNDYSWTFTTGATLDKTPPKVSDTAFGIQVIQDGTHQAVIVAFFSEVMDPATLNSDAVQLTDPSGAAVPVQIQYIGVSALMYPTVPLAPEASYTATVTTAATDIAGNHMLRPKVWTVQTPNLATLTGKPAPTVIATDPGHDVTDVLLGSEITATFGEPMDPATLTNASFLVHAPGGSLVPGTVTVTGVNASFIPAFPLGPDTTYVVDIEPAATDLQGVPLAAEYEWTFTTGEDVAGTPPVVQYTSPTPGETGVTLNKSILVAFDEPMDPASINTATFTVTGEDGLPVDGMVTYTNLSAVFTPDSALRPGVSYTGRVTTGVTDAGGEAMAADYVWQFSTGTEIADTVPQVLFTSPASEALQVPYDGVQIQIAFNEVMDPRTINSDNIAVTALDGTVVPGTFTYLAYVVIFTPSAPLDQFTVYTVTVKSGIKDMEGVPIAHDYTWWFDTTGAM